MRVIIITAFFWLITMPGQANENNSVMAACMAINGYSVEKFDDFDFNKAAGCYQNWKNEKNKQELAELRDFLKHNPRYKYPGQSNNKCFGKPREMPFESAYIEQTDSGFRAGVTYKDKLPADCFQSAPWDNRDVKN